MNPKIQQYFLDILEDRRQERSARLLARFLGGLSLLYGVAVQTRHFLYRLGLSRRKTLGCMIVSVGNLTVGGTGKTPVVEMFARALRDGGRRVAILSRGYKRKNAPLWDVLLRRAGKYRPDIVSDGHKILMNSAASGDEPAMLAKNLPGVAVIVDKNRVKSGSYAIQTMGVDTLILDDGFQYLPLGRKVDVVLVDATNPFGNGRLLPRGILREPLKNLARADYIFITKTEGLDVGPLRKHLREWNVGAPILECRHEPKHLVDLVSSSVKPLSFLQDKKVAVLTAIASPGGFEKALRSLGAQLAITIRYPDHHRFTEREINEVVQEMSRKKVEVIVTTEKDAVRFPSLERRNVPVYFLRVEIQLTEGTRDFNDCVARICNVT